ncbi:5'-nucleotidase, lipoprotein e(P4) family [Hydromonas duriensis]|uniref:5'-nucleotidase (Lipoprotein e(P4) family) n=1 Tax=Hydromonas duriensis TaxID=1527608 RepID=A0A4R6YA19_9BURK|nr:5'-nucleotidase, lipoprotein e(P4) family [Hydromonas duriensis]TDR32361.1 5'-nucleotidase (lipoprotein e(P4) family) [Hydromonas duriensis]
MFVNTQKPRRPLTALIAALCLSLSTTAFAEEALTNKQGPTGDGLSNNLMVAAAWKQTAAENKALYHQAFNIAKERVDAALKKHKKKDKPLAIISDLDETLFDASAYWGNLIQNNKDFFDDAVWDKWVPSNTIAATAGAQDFLNDVKNKGVEIFYVSSRDQGEKTFEYAIANMKALGFPNADAEHVTILRDSSNKEPSQKNIAEKYDVVVYLGDNLNDFQRKYYTKNVDQRTQLMEEDKEMFGRKFIVMPNPLDGHWMRAIFGESEPPANDKNREILKKAATQSTWQP